MAYDVSVIGLGRVGLPLALCFADAGLRVLGVDKDPERLRSLREKRMPFKEPGTGELLARVQLDVTAHAADAARADAIVLTLGTPSFSHIEIDMGDIRSVLDDLLPVLREGQTIVLRSTVAPGTTEFVAGYLEKQRGFSVGQDLFVAHVPERIAADRFMEEIGTLPCIVGGVGEASGEAAARVFAPLGAPIVQTTPVEAELAKVWTNIYRYATFALPNLLMMDCERYGANVFEVIELINRDYRAARSRCRGSRPAPACARTSLRRGALLGAGHAAGGVARQRGRAELPRRRRQAASRRVVPREEGRGARAGLRTRHRRRARLAVAQAHPAVRARARRRCRARPDGPDADVGLRLRGRRRRRRRRRHEPLRVLVARRAVARARAGGVGLPGRRPVERVRDGAGVRVRVRAQPAAARRVLTALLSVP